MAPVMAIKTHVAGLVVNYGISNTYVLSAAMISVKLSGYNKHILVFREEKFEPS